MMTNPLKELVSKRKTDKSLGIPSYCTANDLVIEALLLQAKKEKRSVLIEATANQVNQFGGYTGMKPADFVEFVHKIADKVGCPKELILLGGDHLGPLTWKDLEESEAMEKSKVLVYDFVKAGFTKIHLDTSMKLASDSKDGILETAVIAERGAILFGECMRAFAEIDDGTKMKPVFVIGSEVPIPGGATEVEEGISVTKVEDFKGTIQTYQEVFNKYGLSNAFEDIIAVVVQPGVEFGDSQVFLYEREPAKALSQSITAFEGIVFEGHSTDYQTKECLRNMVEDNIAILKVGPSLTYRFREALYMLSFMEKELISVENRGDFIETLEKVMLEKPNNWKNHYHGDEEDLRQARKYSYSDRARYYFTDGEVKAAIDKLLENMSGITIPMNILHQFMPSQYEKIMRNLLKNNAYEILFDAVLEMASDYDYACYNQKIV